ncbi:MAG: OB-fold nucleic acid binding domain-containing protein [Candidatus Thorarchaeota archaeon]
MQTLQPRQIAIRASVSDVVDGEFIERDRDKRVISPHGVEMKRVALVGFVIEHYVSEADGDKKRYEYITIDDGTGTISAKAWDERSAHLFHGIQEGNLVLVVGMVRKSGDELYISLDFVTELSDPNFMSLHLLERYKTILKRTGLQLPDTSMYQQESLDFSESSQPKEAKPTPSKKTAPSKKTKSSKPKIGGLAGEILSFIQENANPDGVPMKDIVAHFEKKGKKSQDIQKKVFDLTGDVVIYEVKASHYLPSDM